MGRGPNEKGSPNPRIKAGGDKWARVGCKTRLTGEMMRN